MRSGLIKPGRLTALILTPEECSWIGELIENDLDEMNDLSVSKPRIRELLKALDEGAAK